MADQSPPSDRASPVPAGTIMLDRDECYALLAGSRAHVGRLAYVTDGWPVALPVNYVLDGDGVLFRTDTGSKLLAAGAGARVAFEVDEIDVVYRSGWSVLVQGHAEELTDPGDVERAGALGLRAWAQGTKDHLVRITPVQVTGRRLARAWSYPGPTT